MSKSCCNFGFAEVTIAREIKRKNFVFSFAFRLLNRNFGFAEGTLARKYSSKLGIPLA